MGPNAHPNATTELHLRLGRPADSCRATVLRPAPNSLVLAGAQSPKAVSRPEDCCWCVQPVEETKTAAAALWRRVLAGRACLAAAVGLLASAQAINYLIN